MYDILFTIVLDDRCFCFDAEIIRRMDNIHISWETKKPANMPTLEWIGKSKVVNHHLDVPYCVLERKYSYDGKLS